MVWYGMVWYGHGMGAGENIDLFVSCFVHLMAKEMLIFSRLLLTNFNAHNSKTELLSMDISPKMILRHVFWIGSSLLLYNRMGYSFRDFRYRFASYRPGRSSLVKNNNNTAKDPPPGF